MWKGRNEGFFRKRSSRCEVVDGFSWRALAWRFFFFLVMHHRNSGAIWLADEDDL
jgi:hypothetical protein